MPTKTPPRAEIEANVAELDRCLAQARQARKVLVELEREFLVLQKTMEYDGTLPRRLRGDFKKLIGGEASRI